MYSIVSLVEAHLSIPPLLESVAAQCPDVVPDPSNFDDAYFEIRYITVFSK